MTVEDRVKEWLKQPGARVMPGETEFIADMRKAALHGVGYGWMQQVIEWEWQSKGAGAWGPEYFEKRIAELTAKEKAPDREAGVDEILKKYSGYINERPALTSLLYDIDMLPEQCRSYAGAVRLAGLCEVWKRMEKAESMTGRPPAGPQREIIQRVVNAWIDSNYATDLIADLTKALSKPPLPDGAPVEEDPTVKWPHRAVIELNGNGDSFGYAVWRDGEWIPGKFEGRLSEPLPPDLLVALSPPSSASPQAETAGWRSMDSAPKDGTPILLRLGKIVGSGKFGYTPPWGPTVRDGFYFDGATLPSGADGWMPLPSPLDTSAPAHPPAIASSVGKEEDQHEFRARMHAKLKDLPSEPMEVSDD